MRNKLLLALCSFVLVCAAASASVSVSAPPEEPRSAWGGELASELGPHRVGFRTEWLSRTGADGTRRRLTLSVWYPARDPANGKAVTVSELFATALDEGQLDEARDLPRERAFSAALTGDASAIPAETSRRALAASTFARRGASPARGPFPVALWSVRHATALAQAPMSEVLASRGLVVASVWSSDPPLAFLWEDHPPAEKVATIESHAADLGHALAHLRTDPAVDADRVVVLSWSYGGQTAARLQEREAAVRAIVSLDANVVPAAPEESLELRRPLVWLLGRNTSRRGLETVEELGAPWIVARLPELAHGHFNALEGYLPARFGATAAFPWSSAGPEAVEGYQALVRMVVAAAEAFAAERDPNREDVASRLRAVAGDVELELRHAAANR